MIPDFPYDAATCSGVPSQESTLRLAPLDSKSRTSRSIPMGKKGKTISGNIGIMPYFRVSYFSKNGHK
jgi:hypothetical protein